MKKSHILLAGLTLALSTPLTQAAAIGTPPPSPTITVFKGQGIEPATENSPSVYLDVLPASAAPGAASGGGFAVTLSGAWPRSGNTGVVGVSFRPSVDINIYSVGTGGDETLVVSIKDLPVSAAARAPEGPVVYTLKLDNKSVFPTPLQSGNYRAEAIVMLGSSPVIPKPVYTYTEVGGAALNFKVGALHITTLSNISGKIQTSVSYTAYNPANWAAVKAAAMQILDTQAGEIRKWVASSNAAVDGAPRKTPLSAVESSSPGSFTFNLSGQMYGELTAPAMDRLKKLVAGGKRLIPVSGGAVTLYTSAPVTASPYMP